MVESGRSYFLVMGLICMPWIRTDGLSALEDGTGL